MIGRLIRRDLGWAGYILLVSMAFGLGVQWQMVRLSWTGGLATLLEQQRGQRLQTAMQGVKTLNLSQTYALFQQGQALFIDARVAEEYGELHIPGAVNLDIWRLNDQGARALAGIPTDRQMVVYCGMSSCEAALRVAEKLQSLGYTGVQVFMEGFRAWDEAGYPADTSK